MIISDIQSWKKESEAYHPLISYAIQWLADRNLSCTEAGKYEILSDNRMFCMIQEQETEPVSDRKPESHFKYVDVQFLIQGKENIGVARSSPLNIRGVHRPEHDIVFYNHVVNESIITLTEGMFAVFFPDDVHRPCCEVNNPARIRKAVIKISLDLLKKLQH